MIDLKHVVALGAAAALALLGCDGSTNASNVTAEQDANGTDGTAGGDVAVATDTTVALDTVADGGDTSSADGTDVEDIAKPDVSSPEDIGFDDGLDVGLPDVVIPVDTATDGGDAADVIGPEDAGSPADVPTPEDTGSPIDAGAPTGDGETCETAIDLIAASEATGSPDYPNAVFGTLGQSNDYNPYQESGLPPACSLVYDAYGKEVVYFIDLEPGEVLELRYLLEPKKNPGGLYLLDSCDPVTWPDYDGSGKCGSNEYKSQGFCGPAAECDPAEINFLYPKEGVGTKRFWVVLDEVVGDSATGFSLYWVKTPPK